MVHNAQYIKLDECINSYLDESESSIHKYYKCFQLAFRAMTELGLDFFYQVKSVKLPVNDNLTVTLPSDFMNYTKAGILNDRGEVIPLIYNSKLTTYADLLPDRIEKTQDNSLWNFYSFNSLIFYNYWDGFTFNNLYGIPSGAPFVGSFKVDNQNGVILLNESFCWDYLILEYVASPQQGEEYYVPIQFKEAIIAYIRWRDIISLPSSRRGTISDKAQRRHEYYNERRLALARYKPFNLMDAYEWSLTNQRMVIKA